MIITILILSWIPMYENQPYYDGPYAGLKYVSVLETNYLGILLDNHLILIIYTLLLVSSSHRWLEDITMSPNFQL